MATEPRRLRPLAWRGGPRVRQPQPLIAYRLPSGRGATEQPNATDDPVPLTARFWLAVVLAGVATGLFGDLMMWVLFFVEHLTFGDRGHVGFQYLVDHVGALHRVVALLVAGAVGGGLWFVLRHVTKGESADVDDSVWQGTGELSFRRSFGTSLLSELVVGMGASLGRENAPKIMGGASASLIAGWTRLDPAQRRLLVACAAGSGLAAVYNVPLGGALFTAELLMGSIALPVMLPALACAGIATATAWIYLPTNATYVGIPQYHFTGSLLLWSLLFGPVAGLLSVAYVRAIGWVSHHRPTGGWALTAPLVAFGVVGVLGIWYPQLFGNGKDMAHDVFVGAGSLALLGALFALKPIATVLCLGSGASGGLFTPTMSTGAMLGGFLGLAWTHLWHGTPVGAFALVGAAAVLGAALQAPLAALALMLELTHSGFGIAIPMTAATVLATAVARYVDGYSIYSARLPAA
ncbi:MAG TPA: chloride channel protein [Acidimicrobiales bacterium]|nr:chloride channel protein [Acidimicrobiales bacterium]